MSFNSMDTFVILDDDPFQLQLISHQLERLNIKFKACLMGREALAYVIKNNNRTNLILSDLEMPEMDGVEFLRNLSDCGYVGTVAFMSKHDKRVLESVAKLAEAYKLKLLGCLQKPVTTEALSDLFIRWQRHETGIRQAERKKYTPDEISFAIANHHMVNHYQPKVRLRDGVVSGVESLVRWQHPSEGLVYPDQFIGVAEESGLIEDITRAVLRGALNQAKLWYEQAVLIRVAVNVSMDNLKRIDFPDFVQSESKRVGVDPRSLILEVTESRLSSDSRVPLDILTRLRLKQVGLSIDDFGTGHSSLSQLRDLPFDELKIDRSFVHGVAGNHTLGSIFEASMKMGRDLEMKTVAEGVEDRCDWDYLRESGCDLAQGYFVAKPMPGNKIATWIAEWKERRAELYKA